MQGRRRFLKAASGALGGALLSSCGGTSGGLLGGSSGGGTQATLPAGMRFFRIYQSGASDTLASTSAKGTGGVLLNNTGVLLNYGLASGNRLQLEQLLLDFGGERPRVSDKRTAIREGDLVDGVSVDRLHGCALNDDGSLAAILDCTEDGLSQPGIYAELVPGGSPLQDLFDHGDEVSNLRNRATGGLPDGEVQMGAVVGDLDLSHNGDLLFSANFTVDQSLPYQGLFSFNPTQGRAADGLDLIAYSGLGLPESDAIMGGYGLLDLSDDGDYVAQVFLEGPDTLLQRARGQRVEPGSGLITGNIHAGHTRLVHATPSLRGRARGGESHFGPRISNADHLSYVIHHTDDDAELVFAGATAARTGGTSPGGHTIHLPGPGAVGGPAGLCYFVVATDAGLELCVSNGREARTLLSRGDEVDGLTVNNLIFGLHSDQVDRQGRVVLEADFTDGSTGVLLGIPA